VRDSLTFSVIGLEISMLTGLGTGAGDLVMARLERGR
jgi:hypothetical protein